MRQPFLTFLLCFVETYLPGEPLATTSEATLQHENPDGPEGQTWCRKHAKTRKENQRICFWLFLKCFRTFVGPPSFTAFDSYILALVGLTAGTACVGNLVAFPAYLLKPFAIFCLWLCLRLRAWACSLLLLGRCLARIRRELQGSCFQNLSNNFKQST